MKTKELEAIEGADKLLEELEKPFAAIDSNIKELNEKIAEIENEIVEVENPHSVESITAMNEKRQLLETFKVGLERAEAERASIAEKNYDYAQEKAIELLRDYQRKVRKAYQKDHALILQKLDEVRSIYETLKIDAYKAQGITGEFRRDINPYLRPEEDTGEAAPHLSLDRATRINILKEAPGELETGIKGLKPSLY